MMLSRVFMLGFASRNLWIMEMMILRVSRSSMVCNTLMLSVVSTLAMSAALKMPADLGVQVGAVYQYNNRWTF
jgi:hypothetical protein